MKIRGWEGLQDFSKALYKDTYFLKDEKYTEWLDRVTRSYQNDEDHGARMRSYITKYWFHPSTPISSNAGTTRGLPISCYTNTVDDSKEGIFSAYNESFNLGAFGGGIGKVWSRVRGVGAPVGSQGGTSSGVIPFLGISDRATLAISQGGLRRASEAAYLHISHPEIEEFIELRKPTGDQNRRAPNLHHGLVITDAFMDAVINNDMWDLVCPKTGEVTLSINARHLWTKILEVRTTLKGEPYLLFIDRVNALAPQEYKDEGVAIETSNLCTEITLRTDEEHSGVCCLGSVNAEYYDEWKDSQLFIADCSDFLDNVIQDFIDQTEHMEGFQKARQGAIDERSIGLGVMGLHSLYQRRGIPWESPMAKGLNMNVFYTIKTLADIHNLESSLVCPMAKRTGSNKRNIHVTAVAPTMSISSLCNVTSSGIEPWITNAFTKKVKQGSFPVTNKYLGRELRRYVEEQAGPGNELYKDAWIQQQWDSIKKNEGSVQHLDWMPPYTKEVFKTAFEIDQRHIVEHAGDRAPLIDQAQSINLFIKGGSNVQYISDIHILAWRKGVKSLYYLRSSVVNRASTEANTRKKINVKEVDMMSDTCLSCG